ncbi:MAG: outer membrane beta-barrel protein [Chitinophagaceae bacterium]|nr:outer membrane beta-barrel protein [Chitinophagaceae bacterium]
MQPLRDNSDYYNQYIGNPDLKPSFSNSFSLSHNSYNFLKDMFMYQSLNFRFTQNAITNNRVVKPGFGQDGLPAHQYQRQFLQQFLGEAPALK